MGGYDPTTPEDNAETEHRGALYSRCVHDVLLSEATRYLADWAQHPDDPRGVLAQALQRAQGLLHDDLDLLGALAGMLGCSAWDRRWLYATVAFTPAPEFRVQGPIPDRALVDYFVTKLFRRKKSSFTEFTDAWRVFTEVLAAVGAVDCDRAYLRELLSDLGVHVIPEDRNRRRFRLQGLVLRLPAERDSALDALFHRYAPNIWTALETTMLPIWALRRENGK
ncbi:hypothetical protein [Streptosporangium sp. CA-115845]|uniref:hypothetical protein n=1 Tax=Streptosporangium sp. CA-115845 TaxID=3240071 RepID=UPI003D9366BA